MRSGRAELSRRNAGGGLRVAALSAALAVLVSSCSGEPNAADRAEPTSPSATDSGAAEDGPTAEPVGRDLYVSDDNVGPIREAVEVIAELPLVNEKEMTRSIFMAMASEHLLLDQVNHRTNASRGLVLYSPDGSRASRELPRHPGKHEVVVSADVSSEFVTWMEAGGGQIGVTPWTLYAYDRGRGDVLRLSEAPRLGNRKPPSVPGWTGPVIAGEKVFWAQVGGRPRAKSVGIWGCTIRTCEPEEIVDGAAFPGVSGQHLYYVTSEMYRGGDDVTASALERTDLRTGARQVIRSFSSGVDGVPNGLAAAGAHVVVTMDAPDGGYVLLIDTDTKERLTIGSSRGERFGYPRVTERFAVWADGNASPKSRFGGYLWDFRRERLFSVGNTAGLYLLAADGSRLAWQESEGSTALEDIQTVVGELK